MDQQEIDKLLEIKKLYEAGILTKEEMEAEKDKILRPATIVTESTEEQSASNDKSQQTTSNNNVGQKPGLSKDKTWIIVVSIIAVIIIIAIIIRNGKNPSNQVYDDDYATEVVDSDTIAVVEDVDEEVAMDEDQVEYTDAKDNSDTWVGSFTISGSMYRMCHSMALLSLSPSDGTTFTGKITLMLGNEDDMGKFDFFYGELTGAVRGDLSEDGSSIRIYLEDYNVEEGRMGDLISNKEIQNGQLLFILKYSNYGYEVEPVMAMSSFFDGVADKTQIVKK